MDIAEKIEDAKQSDALLLIESNKGRYIISCPFM